MPSEPHIVRFVSFCFRVWITDENVPSQCGVLNTRKDLCILLGESHYEHVDQIS